MRHTLMAIATAFVTTVSGVAMAQQTKSLAIGATLPATDKTFTNTSGGSDMAYYKGADKNGFLVVFSCNTCPFVVKNEGTIKRTLAYAKKNKVGVVIVNSNEAKREGEDSRDEMKKYAIAQGYDVPYLIDKNSELADMFGASHTPEIFLFDKNNKLVYKGAMNDNPGSPKEATVAYINDAIDAMVAGKAPQPAETKSIGCSIKRK